MEILVSFFLIIFLVILVLRILSPYVLRFLAKRFFKRYGINFDENTNSPNQRRKKESDISGSSQEKIIGKDVGEYVDFEEIKD